MKSVMIANRYQVLFKLMMPTMAESHGGKRGRDSENKTPFVTAVSINEEGHPIRMNFTVVKGFRLS